MVRTRYERRLVRTRAAYRDAAVRLAEATAEWHAVAAPLLCRGDEVPAWTTSQAMAAERMARAWVALASSRRAWEELLRDIGCQR